MNHDISIRKKVKITSYTVLFQNLCHASWILDIQKKMFCMKNLDFKIAEIVIL